MIRIQTKVQWQAQRIAGSSRWLVACEPMDLLLEAESAEEIDGLINEAMHLLLTDLVKENELDQFLKDRGWQAVNVPGRGDAAEFDVPYELLVRGNMRDTQHRAA